MSFRGFKIPDMVTVTGPWATPEHPERLSLLALLSTVGMVRFIDVVHGDILALLTDEERARLGLLRNGAGLKNVRHDDLARVTWFCLRMHEYLLGATPEGRAITDMRTVLFPDKLAIVRAGYRESAGRAAARIAQLTAERSTVLAGIPVQGRSLLDVVQEWNQVGLEMGEIQDQRVTPARPAGERNKRRLVRQRWIRVVKAVMSSLELEAEESPEARRILDRVTGIQAEVRRRARAGNDTDDGDEDGENDPEDNLDDEIDDEIGAAPGQEPDALLAPVTENR